MKGITLLLTLIVLAIGMAITFGIAGIFFSEVTSSGQISSSMKAFYAADAAVEAALYKERNGGGLVNSFICNDNAPRDTDTCLSKLENNATYTYEVTDSPSPCPGNARTINAIGTFFGTKRSIEIHYDC